MKFPTEDPLCHDGTHMFLTGLTMLKLGDGSSLLFHINHDLM